MNRTNAVFTSDSKFPNFVGVLSKTPLLENNFHCDYVRVINNWPTTSKIYEQLPI